jgi:aspartyl-tRNA(Asn)/glutamyl-tRNA(Gln) amidotransferase subunit B
MSSPNFEPVIGLEVHCQLLTETKLFCGCPTRFGAEPNHHACPVCLGMPGVLPVINEKAVDHAVRMALAIGARVNPVSVFARKQYFYPDLPKGYQITQYDLPYCEGGDVELASGKAVRLIRIHLEEDAGKNVHGGDGSYVDVNRAGMPLMEIVSHPDLRSPEEAGEYLRRLRALVRHLGISDGNMEEGSFRCDANVSLRPAGQEAFGTRCEIKNLNSFRNVERAIHYEIARQGEILAAGGKVAQQTVQFDANTGRTSPLRSKEESHDYRYFPDPDLKPLHIPSSRIERLKATLPELPEAMAARFRDSYGLTADDAALLTSERELAAYFEGTVAAAGAKAPPKLAANWIATELMREVHARAGEGGSGWGTSAVPLTPAQLGELVGLVGDGTISGKIAKTVFQELVEHGGTASDIIAKKGLVQVSDDGAILEVVARVVAASPNQVAQYVSGKDKIFGYFVGQVMKEGGGKLNPAKVNQLLKAALDAKKG